MSTTPPKQSLDIFDEFSEASEGSDDLDFGDGLGNSSAQDSEEYSLLPKEGFRLPSALTASGQDSTPPPQKRRKVDVADVDGHQPERILPGSEGAELPQKKLKFQGKRFMLTYPGHQDAKRIHDMIVKQFNRP